MNGVRLRLAFTEKKTSCDWNEKISHSVRIFISRWLAGRLTECTFLFRFMCVFYLLFVCSNKDLVPVLSVASRSEQINEIGNDTISVAFSCFIARHAEERKADLLLLLLLHSDDPFTKHQFMWNNEIEWSDISISENEKPRRQKRGKIFYDSESLLGELYRSDVELSIQLIDETNTLHSQHHNTRHVIYARPPILKYLLSPLKEYLLIS